MADSAVLPSYYRKGQPHWMREAMYMTVPVLTTPVADVPGWRETVTKPINGPLMPPRAAVAVAEAIAGFVDAPDAVARMGGASHERVMARFSAAHVNGRILGVLRECLR
jgi:glycosyltransferase involved in cell wall biosynthesis